MRVLFLFLFIFRLAYSQHPQLFFDASAFLGTHIPAAVGIHSESHLALMLTHRFLFEESVLHQQLYFDTPTKSDRWGWGMQLFLHQGSIEKYQKLGGVLSYRIPLDTQTNLYLCSQLNTKSLLWQTERIRNIEIPDPLLASETVFWATFDTSLLLRIRDFYGGFSLSNWNLSDARETYTLDSSLLQYKVLFGGVFELLSKHRFHGVLGMEKEDSKYSYWTRLQWEAPSGILLAMDGGFPWQWQGQFAFPLSNHWKFGFNYGRYSNRLNQRFLGMALQYAWIPIFRKDYPVESLDYKFSE
ncbi:MAG: type IX secretion system membrane protein PorP/SprF [Flavobacteriaceae bacterium]